MTQTNPRREFILAHFERNHGSAPEQIGVSQAVIEAWLRGGELPEHALRDFCLLLGLEREDLDLDPEAYPIAEYPFRDIGRRSMAEPGLDGHWGMFGIRPPGARKTLMLPIRESDADRLVGDQVEPFILRGLGMTVAWINPLAVNGLILYGSGDKLEDDEEDLSPLDTWGGINPALFDGMVDAVCDGEYIIADRTQFSERYATTLRDFIRKVGAENVYRESDQAVAHLVDGTCLRILQIDDPSTSLSDLVRNTDLGKLGQTITFLHESRIIRLPVSRIAMITMPRTALKATASVYAAKPLLAVGRKAATAHAMAAE